MKNYSDSKKLIMLIYTFLIFILLLLTSVELFAFNSNSFYIHEFNRHSVLDKTHPNISIDEALYIKDEIIMYLKGERNVLSGTIHRESSDIEFLSEREKLHLSDVKIIVRKYFIFRNFSFILFCIMTLLLINDIRHKKNMRDKSLAFIKSALLINSFFAIIALLICSNFDKWFIKLHLLIFDNNNWLLSSDKDNLVNLLPEAFFEDIIKYSLSLYALFVLILILINTIYIIFTKNKNASQIQESKMF